MPMKYKVDIIARLNRQATTQALPQREDYGGIDAPEDKKRANGVLGYAGNDL